MAADSAIEWTHHTWNPWTGCAKVSEGCRNCYAEAWADRFGHVEWGPGKHRRRAADAAWRKPLAWNRQAKEQGIRLRVFPSLCDPFDDEVPTQWLADLFELIDRTPHLDWMLLTKRPHLIRDRIFAVVSQNINDGQRAYDAVSLWISGVPPRNVWLGVSVEDQATADKRIPQLLGIPSPAFRNFVSCEPLLGPVDLRRLPELRLPDHDAPPGPRCPPLRLNALTGDHWLPSGRDRMGLRGARIDWVIAGGESGPNARPMHPDWARSLRDQCQTASVPFFFKQWGEWAPNCIHEGPACRKTPRPTPGKLGCMFRCGKQRAGREIDGHIWDEVPA